MLGALYRLRLAIILASFATLSLGGTALAQAQGDGESDLLDQVRRREKVAAQKLEADLRQALHDAERLARTDRAKAVDLLKKALILLEEDTVLSPERRDALTRMLRDRIRVTESAPDGAEAGAQQRDKKPLPSARSSEGNRRDAEQKKARQALEAVQQLQADGKTEAANREANALARQHPHDAAIQAAEQTTRTADQLANARRQQRDYERHLASAYRDIDKSATPSDRDLAFPNDWKERTKGRTTALSLTAKERSILQALNTTISVNFKDSKLEDVIEYLQTYTGQAILLDRESMKELEISYETAVTLNVKGVTVRTVLRKILGDVGMTYVIKDETIQATSAQRAKEMMVVRRYYVGDLLAGMGALGPLGGPQVPLGNPYAFPNGFANFTGFPFQPVVTPQAIQAQAFQKMESVKQLIELIQGSVEPQSWHAHGGSGTITFHAPSMSLVIKQSAEVHALLGSGGLLQ